MRLTGAQARNCGIDVPKQNKMRNEPVVIDGIWFQSTKEGTRYAELRLMEKAGAISLLCRQFCFDYWSEDNSHSLFTYKADFSYFVETPSGRKRVVEDVKPIDKKTGKFRLTTYYKLVKKLIEDRYSIKITEV